MSEAGCPVPSHIAHRLTRGNAASRPFRVTAAMLCEKPPHLLSCPPTRSFYEIAGLRVLNRFLSCKRLDGIELRSVPLGDVLIRLAPLFIDLVRQCLRLGGRGIHDAQVPVRPFT